MIGEFKLFMGVVEDINDPLKISRVRVRAIGYHTEDKSELPTSDLPWASFMSATAQMSAPMVLPGDWVMGVFLDGEDGQYPVVLGSLVGLPTDRIDPWRGFCDPAGKLPLNLNEGTNSRLSRNQNIDSTTQIGKKIQTLAEGIVTGDGKEWDEPKTRYNAIYPANKVLETPSGHIIEMDDTPGAERVHVYHISGSFTEFHPDGKVVHRSVDDEYSLSMGQKSVYAAGNVHISSAGTTTILANDDMHLSVGRDLKIRVGEDLVVDVGGDVRIGSKKDVAIFADNKILNRAKKSGKYESENIEISSTNGTKVSSARNTLVLGSSVAIRNQPGPPAQTQQPSIREPYETPRIVLPTSSELERYLALTSPDPSAVVPGIPYITTTYDPPTPANNSVLEQASAPIELEPIPGSSDTGDLDCVSAPAPPFDGQRFRATVAREMTWFRTQPAMMKALELIREFEGFVPNYYRDAVGVPTIGWGFTDSAIRSQAAVYARNGRNNSFFERYEISSGSWGGLSPEMTITQEEADELLTSLVIGRNYGASYFESVYSEFKRLQPAPQLTPEMIAALVSWTYNLGIGNLRRSTLFRVLSTARGNNTAAYTQAADEILKWDKAGGRVLRGLTRRRQRERCLFVS